MPPSLDGVRAKIDRAETHFKLVSELAAVVRDDYGVVRKKGYSPHFHTTSPEFVSVFLKLGQPRDDFPLVVGDCVHNLRTALDYIVYQLVLANNKTPTTNNLFPICNSSQSWNGALKRDRLCGVHLKAKTLIERLQPCHRPDNRPLWILSELENIDKHRALLTASAMLVQQRVTFSKDGAVGVDSSASFGGIERDGACLLGYDFGATDSGTGDDMEVQLQGTSLVAFEDAPVKDVFVVEQLRECIDFVKDRVVPRFDPFF